jgi:hypothetical protein
MKMPAPLVFPTVTPADVEALGVFFFTPILAPTPVATRVPRPQDDSDTVNGFLRIEAGNTTPLLEFRSVAWDLSFIMHAYSPSEIEAADIIGKAMAEAASAHFKRVTGFYIVDVLNVFGGNRLPEPKVPDLVRYRAAVTWRVTGRVT